MAALKESVKKRIKKIKLLVMDCDGVLTDGGIIYDCEGREIKVFNVRDGHGIKLLKGPASIARSLRRGVPRP